MSEFSIRMAAVALALLEKKGEPVVLERNVTSPGMSASGDRSSAPADTPTQGVYLPTGGTTNVDGVDRKAAKIILAKTEPAPSAGDHVTIAQGANAGHYLIARAKNWAPDGDLIYSDLEVAL